MSDASDIDLLEEWRRGDRVSGNMLVTRHFRSVYAFFESKVGDLADDLAQATFLSCVEARDEVDPQLGSFKSYLFGIARHVLLRHFRSRRSAKIDFGTVSVEDLGATTPSRFAAAREEERRLWFAMRRLSVDAQITLELHYWESMSTSELAVVLGIEAGTARSRLHRARAALRQELARLGSDARGQSEESVKEAAISIRDSVSARGRPSST